MTLLDREASALLSSLTERRDTDKLAELAAGADRTLAKGARRALHHLRSRGVPIPPPAPAVKKEAPLGQPLHREPELHSLASVWYEDGLREIIYLHHEPGRELTLWSCQQSESLGILELRGGVITRKRWRELSQLTLADETWPHAPVSGALARFLIEQAAERSRDLGRPLPRAYGSLALLQRAEAPARHPVHGFLDEEQVAAQAGLPGRMAQVLKLPETRTWIPEPQVVRRGMLLLEEVLTSQLLISDRQRMEQMIQALRRLQGEVLVGPFRERMARRFLDTGHLILQRAALGRSDGGRDHAADAALAVAAARQLEDLRLPAEEVPAAWPFFERILSLFYSSIVKKDDDAKGKAKQEAGLIITP